MYHIYSSNERFFSTQKQGIFDYMRYGLETTMIILFIDLAVTSIQSIPA